MVAVRNIFSFVGTPNKPSTTSLMLTENEITINWLIDMHKLRPVGTYLIQIQITRSDDQELNSGSEIVTSGDRQNTNINNTSFGGSSKLVEFNVTVNVSAAELSCITNTRGDIDHYEYTLMQETEFGRTYSFIVCAINDFGTTCGEVVNITATPRPVVTSLPPLVTPESTTPPAPQATPSSTTLTPQGTPILSSVQSTVTLSATTLPPRRGPKVPTGLEGVFVGIVFAVIMAVLLCCLLCVSVALLCACCLQRSGEKNYWPEEKG